jgi:tRNA(fMet)-specific endonuclease VapC
LLVLDTDHFSELERDSIAGHRLAQRLETSTLPKAASIVTVEEQLRGWLADLGRHPAPSRLINAYGKLQRQIEIFTNWTILPWNQDAAEMFSEFRRKSVRIGTLDLRIACITMAHDATLLTRNTVHFMQVPGLQFENCLG